MSPLDFLRDEPLIVASLLIPVLPMLVALGIMASIGMRDLLQRDTLDEAELDAVNAELAPALAGGGRWPGDDAAQDDDADDDADADEAEPQETDAADNPMGDLLSSVFQEEVDMAHYDVLLFDVAPSSIDDLAEALRLTHQQLTGKAGPG